MTDKRRDRLVALGAKLRDEHIDALVLTSLPNIRYLT
jgi:Xaa-Pro aminopeptidase